MHHGKFGKMNKSFWNGKKVLITGHTGFKGSWLSVWLKLHSAELVGLSERSHGKESMFVKSNLDKYFSNKKYNLNKYYNIQNYDDLKNIIKIYNPDIIFHLAAQPLVIDSYAYPIETFTTNIIGTLNLLHASQFSKNLKSIVSVTTDKVYKINRNSELGYSEDDSLGGIDPYSCSKSCADLISQSYFNSFLKIKSIGISPVRSGNVIGGGDWAKDRIVPDIFRNFINKTTLKVRNPNFIRPWQHVLEPLYGYILLAEKLYKNPNKFSRPINFGPNKKDQFTVKGVVKLFNKNFKGKLNYVFEKDDKFKESKILTLNSDLAKKLLNWSPKLSIEDSISNTFIWYKNYFNNKSTFDITEKQIMDYENLVSK